MGLRAFFRRKERTVPPEYAMAVKFTEAVEELLKSDSYMARSDYSALIGEYGATYASFHELKKLDALDAYCKKNRLPAERIENFLAEYDDIRDPGKGSEIFSAHNREFVARHMEEDREYLDSVLAGIDKNIALDDEQREVVLSDEDYTLVIAGAGSGKTTAVSAKVKYLVDKKGINPRDILVVSFTNKAVDELKERINVGLGIDCPISTFHRVGMAIMRKQDDGAKNVASDAYIYYVVRDYFKETILKNPALVDKLILFFGSYLDLPYDGGDREVFMRHVSRQPLTTLKADLAAYNDKAIERKTKKGETIMDEQVRSKEEVRIANFLYLNSVDYTYEEAYRYALPGSKKLYTPDFCLRQGGKTVYLEHFGISESGEHSVYTTEELQKYKESMRDKIEFHRRHGTRLIYTFSKYKDGRDTLDHLASLLKKEGFILTKRNSEEVFRKLVENEENRYVYKMVGLVGDFISNFKTFGYDEKKFDEFRRTGNVRDRLFFDICEDCYLEYQKKLRESGRMDFQDMINESARIIRENSDVVEKLTFKYLIVDEYQDISRQRFNLTKELSDACGAKVVAVGDDWQSIFAFSGSDITLFTDFCKIMGYGKELQLTHTYRGPQGGIDIAGSFVQKNPSQKKKTLVSVKDLANPVVVQTYSEEHDRKKFKGKGGQFYHFALLVEKLIEYIQKANKRDNIPERSSILIIGRYNFDVTNLTFTNRFTWDEANRRLTCNAYPSVSLDFLTAHSSKGLGYDNVIIINGSNEVRGFPSKIEDDPVMRYVTTRDDGFEYAEERRLFYVALTRTKNRVFIMAPETHPSEFVLELVRDYEGVKVLGKMDKTGRPAPIAMNRCPVCGYPVQIRYNPNYGLKLWMCANEPELCNFITNDLSGGKLSIRKCTQCDGYLIVKNRKDTNDYFLGCTGYKEDGTGCNVTMSPGEYFREEAAQAAAAKGWRERKDENPDEMPSRERKTAEADFPRAPKKEPPAASKGTSDEKPAAAARKRQSVTKEEIRTIDGERFSLIATSDGTLITDVELLSRLITVRAAMAEEKGVSAGVVASKAVLVGLSTYPPGSMEEFLSLRGTSERMFAEYGRRFLDEIREYLSTKKT
ncbi:MAG: UvrD-helicase domain-containing protein [Clostridia bacterium]|nr:UvrD-helicase domain-containing protein [Clostridia bacterium]